MLERITYAQDTRRVFDGFVRLSACALAAQTREAEYIEEAKRWKPEELKGFSHALGCLVEEMESKPFEDLIGGYYMEFALSSKGQQWNGEYHTPKPVCDMMAAMTIGELPPGNEPFTICEPACGAGAMILSIGQHVAKQRRRLRVTAIDINKTACDMAFINTTLWGIPTRVINGNTISMEFWHQWHNFHWLCPWLQGAPNPEQEAEILTLPQQGEPPTPEQVEQLTMAFA